MFTVKEHLKSGLINEYQIDDFTFNNKSELILVKDGKLDILANCELLKCHSKYAIYQYLNTKVCITHA